MGRAQKDRALVFLGRPVWSGWSGDLSGLCLGMD